MLGGLEGDAAGAALDLGTTAGAGAVARGFSLYMELNQAGNIPMTAQYRAGP